MPTIDDRLARAAERPLKPPTPVVVLRSRVARRRSRRSRRRGIAAIVAVAALATGAFALGHRSSQHGAQLVAGPTNTGIDNEPPSGNTGFTAQPGPVPALAATDDGLLAPYRRVAGWVSYRLRDPAGGLIAFHLPNTIAPDTAVVVERPLVSVRGYLANLTRHSAKEMAASHCPSGCPIHAGSQEVAAGGTVITDWEAPSVQVDLTTVEFDGWTLTLDGPDTPTRLATARSLVVGIDGDGAPEISAADGTITGTGTRLNFVGPTGTPIWSVTLQHGCDQAHPQAGTTCLHGYTMRVDATPHTTPPHTQDAQLEDL